MRIGLTGNIACGKSTISNTLSQIGVKVIDVDKISHEVIDSGGVKLKIAQFFGTDVFRMDGGVDRRKLGEIVFGNPARMEILEGIMRPLIYKRVEEEIEDYPNCIVDCFEIFDTPLEKLVDEVWVVDCPNDLQYERLRKRNPDLTPLQVTRRIHSQKPMKKFMDRAAVYYNNYGTREELIEYFVPRYLRKQDIVLPTDPFYGMVYDRGTLLN